MKKLTFIILLILGFMGYQSCSSGSDSGKKETEESYTIGGDNNADTEESRDEEAESSGEEDVPQSVKEGKGVGPVKEVELTNPLNEEWVEKGKAVHGQKCAACHKLNDQRSVGPGWEGITNNRKPEWIMNMIMNTDVMLAKDPEAQKQLERCMTRMPNQDLSRETARKVVEFMRQNDMKKTGKKDQAVQQSS